MVPIPWQSSNGALRFWKEQKPNGLKARAFNKPAYISKVALDIGMKALKGEEIPKFTEVPLDIINEDQIDDFYRPDLSDRVWLPTYLPDDVVIKLFPKE